MGDRAQVVLLEGPLKKRGGTMPVMHDRYCVATWEELPTTGKAVVLRTFKSGQAYAENPHKPLENAQALKCVSAWDGKGNFHTYPFGFTVETRDKKLLMCAAPTREDQRKWLELLTVATEEDRSPVGDNGSSHATSSGQHHTRVADKSALFANSEDEDEDDEDDEQDENYGKAAAAAVQHARRYEQEQLPHAENDLLSDEDGADDNAQGRGYYDSDDDDRRARGAPVSPLALSPPDDKLLFRAGSSESLTSSLGNKHDEPDDWGLYGDSSNGNGDGPSRYDVVDGPVLSLDTDLLNGAPKSQAVPLASDDFLFEQNGPTFGAVVVPASNGRGRPGSTNDFVDPVLQARLARKHEEKQRKRVTKKLESNRDLYAEMAAARLTSMRKDAKTKPRPSVVHRRRGEDDDDDDDDEDDDEEEGGWSDGETVDDERYRTVSAAETSRTSKTSTPKALTPKQVAMMTPFELEEIDSEDDPFIKRQSLQEKAKKKSKQDKRSSKTLHDDPTVDAQQEDGEEAQATGGGLFGEDDLLFGEASMPTEPTAEADTGDVPATTVEADELDGEEEARRRRREKRRLKRLQQEQDEATRLEVVARSRQASVSSGPLPDEPVRRSSMDDQWQRATESQKRKDERRRARKEKARQEADAAAAAEELARQHREEMKRLEEEELKQERRERKERKKSKEKSALEKKAKELKKKEVELLAEAEKLKQSQDALLKADEIKDVSRKAKRRDKYTSPTERIQRRDKEVEQAAALASSNSEAMSTALVVVDPITPAAVTSTPTTTEPHAVPAAEPVAAVAPPASAPAVASPAVAEAGLAATTPVPPVSAPTVPTTAPEVPSQTAAVPQAPQSAPATTMQMPMGYPLQAPYAPGYPATTPFAMPMSYAAPYSAVHYSTTGFPAVPYGPGVTMPTPYYPHLGYVGGIAPMTAPGQMQQAFAMMQPPLHATASSAQAEEERFIGPQLPSPKSFDVDHPPAPAAPASAPASRSKAPTSSVGSLPDLPDVAAF